MGGGAIVHPAPRLCGACKYGHSRIGERKIKGSARHSIHHKTKGCKKNKVQYAQLRDAGAGGLGGALAPPLFPANKESMKYCEIIIFH